MKKSGITISEKHGINPCIPKCFFCGKDKNEIILFGRLPNDQEAPRGSVINKEPCDECAEYMRIGIIVIVVRDGEKGGNPYRTGGFFVIKEEAVKKMCPDLGDSRVMFIEESAAKMVGLVK
jgi:hypothetical protein